MATVAAPDGKDGKGHNQDGDQGMGGRMGPDATEGGQEKKENRGEAAVDRAQD